MPGPMRDSKPVSKPQNTFKTLKRIISYMSAFKLQLVLVIIAIVVSASTQIIGTSFLKKVVDSYIQPLFLAYDQVLFHGFVRTLMIMGGIYCLGALSTYVYSRVMLNISTKTLYNLRVDFFQKMQRFEIKYFYTHALVYLP